MSTCLFYLVTRLGLFLRREEGVTTIEYGILAAGLAVIVGALVADGGSFASTLEKIFENILNQLPQSSTTGGGGAG
jgi:pilus assembly protein Flp/PilA